MIIRFDYTTKWGNKSRDYDTDDKDDKEGLLLLLKRIASRDQTLNLYHYEFHKLEPISSTALLSDLEK